MSVSVGSIPGGGKTFFWTESSRNSHDSTQLDGNVTSTAVINFLKENWGLNGWECRSLGSILGGAKRFFRSNVIESYVIRFVYEKAEHCYVLTIFQRINTRTKWHWRRKKNESFKGFQTALNKTENIEVECGLRDYIVYVKESTSPAANKRSIPPISRRKYSQRINKKKWITSLGDVYERGRDKKQQGTTRNREIPDNVKSKRVKGSPKKTIG